MAPNTQPVLHLGCSKDHNLVWKTLDINSIKLFEDYYDALHNFSLWFFPRFILDERALHAAQSLSLLFPQVSSQSVAAVLCFCQLSSLTWRVSEFGLISSQVTKWPGVLWIMVETPVYCETARPAGQRSREADGSGIRLRIRQQLQTRPAGRINNGKYVASHSGQSVPRHHPSNDKMDEM